MNDMILIDAFSFAENLVKFIKRTNLKIESYVEFGCYNGTSLITVNKVFDYLKIQINQYYAFDSFKGLPKLSEQDDTIFQEGLYSYDKKQFLNNLNSNKFPTEKLTIFEGFFSDTFKSINKTKLKKFDIIMLDCDLYSSTKQALNFSFDLLNNNAILIFDDWFSSQENQGQQKAFKEFIENHKNIDIIYEDTYKYFDRISSKLFYIKKQ